ncbi:hypothetical protein PPRY_a3583 [Pseudoalteromonas prydzensis ACAM 620]|nr:hypothetical protein [Pseudoalteromonas prydzensis ACAM 620]
MFQYLFLCIVVVCEKSASMVNSMCVKSNAESDKTRDKISFCNNL